MLGEVAGFTSSAKCYVLRLDARNPRPRSSAFFLSACCEYCDSIIEELSMTRSAETTIEKAKHPFVTRNRSGRRLHGAGEILRRHALTARDSMMPILSPIFYDGTGGPKQLTRRFQTFLYDAAAVN